MKTKRNAQGHVVYFDMPDFTELFFDAARCFMCGEHVSTRPFNDEHVVPRWIQRAYSIAHAYLTLPGGGRVRYDGYTIRCCQECNGRLGAVNEIPLSELLKKDCTAVNNEFVAREGSSRHLYIWLCFMFFKSAISKRRFKEKPWEAKTDATIAQGLSLGILHHLHIMARAPFTNAEVEDKVFGSMFTGPATGALTFDYCDNMEAGTIMLKLGDKFIIGSLLDGGAANGLFFHEGGLLDKPLGTFSTLQIRELFARYTTAALDLANRPEFLSWYDNNSGRYAITSRTEGLPVFEPEEGRNLLGEMMFHYLKDHLIQQPDILKAMAKGSATFLFDDQGRFIDNAPNNPD